mmetsp:Transcript_47856/g.135178  ORF Transcript_47856/g.135178 Transcript_47856/m.135178 type:complete len:506 (-) Transcript_47856:290-1807(-)
MRLPNPAPTRPSAMLTMAAMFAGLRQIRIVWSDDACRPLATLLASSASAVKLLGSMSSGSPPQPRASWSGWPVRFCCAWSPPWVVWLSWLIRSSIAMSFMMLWSCSRWRARRPSSWEERLCARSRLRLFWHSWSWRVRLKIWRCFLEDAALSFCRATLVASSSRSIFLLSSRSTWTATCTACMLLVQLSSSALRLPWLSWQVPDSASCAWAPLSSASICTTRARSRCRAACADFSWSCFTRAWSEACCSVSCDASSCSWRPLALPRSPSSSAWAACRSWARLLALAAADEAWLDALARASRVTLSRLALSSEACSCSSAASALALSRSWPRSRASAWACSSTSAQAPCAPGATGASPASGAAPRPRISVVSLPTMPSRCELRSRSCCSSLPASRSRPVRFLTWTSSSRCRCSPACARSSPLASSSVSRATSSCACAPRSRTSCSSARRPSSSPARGGTPSDDCGSPPRPWRSLSSAASADRSSLVRFSTEPSRCRFCSRACRASL